MLFIIVNLIMFGSCDERENDSAGVGGIIVNEPRKADNRMEQISSAIKDNDKEALKLLFSQKAINENDDFDNELDSFYNYFQGDIESWERGSWSSDETIEYGNKSLMIRSSYKVITDKEVYFFS